MKSLEDVLQYDNEDVKWRFRQHLDLSVEESNEIFTELKKWLWLCANANLDRQKEGVVVPNQLVIDDNVLIIDEMWHNFICFTFEYEAFCINNFGFFIHHFPSTEQGKENVKLKVSKDPYYQINKRKIQYSYVYDYLGEETLIKWYEIYPNKYPGLTIKSLRKK